MPACRNGEHLVRGCRLGTSGFFLDSPFGQSYRKSLEKSDSCPPHQRKKKRPFSGRFLHDQPGFLQCLVLDSNQEPSD